MQHEMLARPRLFIVLLIVPLLVVPRALAAQTVVGVMGITDEIVAIERLLQDSREVTVRGHVFRAGTLNGRQVVVGRSPAGKVNAAIVATVLIGHFNPTALFFSGTAGAVDPTLRPGDVVIGTSVAQHDVGLQTPSSINRRGLRNAVTGEMDPILVPAPDALVAAAKRSISGLTLRPVRTSEGERVPRIVEGVIVTGDVFLADPIRRDELRASLGATAIEMEGAAVIQACRQFGVSCLVVRSITDRADGQALSNYREYIASASENAAAVVAAIITSREKLER